MQISPDQVAKFQGMKVLVVENNASLAKSVRGLLEKWGHEAQLCRRAKDAMRFFRTEDYDLVLMEVRLPDMKGEELISRLKDFSPDTRIVAMTASNSRELETRIREQGILYYMVKPLETEHLRSLLEHQEKRTRGPKQQAVWS
jgi:DNA-binding response OmpR family regulator